MKTVLPARHALITLCLGLAAAAGLAHGIEIVQQVSIHNEDGRFAAWPRNGGMWAWGDEIAVVYTLGYFKKDDGHDIDRDRPSETRIARSMDGGETWVHEIAPIPEGDPIELEQPADFLHPDFALRFRSQGFHLSYDRGRTWAGPYALPDFNRSSVQARTNYVVEGPHTLRATITVAKDAGGEGVVIHIITEDGGRTWREISQVTPEPGAQGYSIMPTTIRISESEWLSVVRRREIEDDQRFFWIESYVSDDDGETWTLINKPTEENAGNPGHLTILRDGRLALVYGHRVPEYGQRGRLSSDNGQTWSDEFILRDDGIDWDLGYPVSVQRTDGKIVTVYYHNSAEYPERVYLAATIWDPGEGSGSTPYPEYPVR